MSDTPYAFKVGDRVVLTWLGQDQPEGVVTRINVLRTHPSLYTVSVVFESGKDLSVGPACLRLTSEKSGLPVATGRPLEPTPLYPGPSPVHTPLLAPDWEEKDLSEAALAEAVADWERSVGYIERGYDYRNDIDEYDYDLFNRECIHVFLLGFACQKRLVPSDLAIRIADADRRYMDLTVERTWVKSAQDYDPQAFWYYFRWPRALL